jgi:glutamyl-tRNA reductase
MKSIKQTIAAAVIAGICTMGGCATAGGPKVAPSANHATATPPVQGGHSIYASDAVGAPATPGATTAPAPDVANLPPGHPRINSTATPGNAPNLPPGHPAIDSSGAVADNKPNLPPGHPAIGPQEPAQAASNLPPGHPAIDSAGVPASTQPSEIGTLSIQEVQCTPGGPAVGADPVEIEFVVRDQIADQCATNFYVLGVCRQRQRESRPSSLRIGLADPRAIAFGLNRKACRHFFRVVSGLDSMVLGECQIVNQVKQAYTLACEQGTTGRVLNRLFHHAFEVGKRARSGTAIAEGKTSVPSVAVDVAKSIFSDFTDKQTLVVGAGEVARLVCQHLASAQSRKFVVMSRTLNNARALAEACHADAAPFEQFDHQMVDADIVLMAIGSSQPILTVQRMQEIQKRRQNRLIYIVDLAVPRNVDPEVAKLEGVYLYNVDDLGAIVTENQNHRAAALAQCEQILDEEVTNFIQWLSDVRLNPIIARMYRDAKFVRDTELDRLLRKCPDLTDSQKQAISQVVDRLVGKFMHPCVHSIRRRPTPEMLALAGALHDANADREDSESSPSDDYVH